VSGATASLGVPGRITGAWATALVKGYDERGGEIVVEDDFRRMFYFAADLDFFPRFGLSLAAGRSFERGDFDNSLIVNQRALPVLGLDSAEAALDRMVMTGYGRAGRIVGVVRDFHFEGMQAEIEPLVITCGTGGHPANQFNSLTLTLSGPDLPATLAAVESAWIARFPEFPYSYRFLDEIFDEWYRAERGTERMLTIFMLLGLVIAALGLFGLASFTAERRTREIGIRKVLGASTPSIVAKLGWEFFRWVLIANLIAWPAAWLIMRGWLDGFAYRTSLGAGVFGAAAFVTLAVAGAAVARQSLKAARADPASTLRYE
jgi:putative ABC transport system permease protein